MNTVRWNIAVSPDTDQSVRMYLAGQGGRKGDLSRFIEEAVRAHILELSDEDTLLDALHSSFTHFNATACSSTSDPTHVQVIDDKYKYRLPSKGSPFKG